MANAYKGITIRLGLDSTDLNRGIREAKKEMSGVPAELRKIERALKLDPGNTALLSQQQAALRQAVRATSDELAVYRAAREQASAGEIDLDEAQWARLEADIAMCEQRLDGYRSALADSIVKQNAMESSLGRAGAKVEEFGERLEAPGQRVEKIGGALTRTLTPALIAMGAAGVAAAVEVDDSLTGVRKTVDGTEEQYQKLKQAAVDFSKTNAVSASQILDIQALGAQLGYNIEELQEFGEVVSGLDIATNMSADEAATELAQFANIMGMAHGQTRNYGSTIVALGNSFATTEADISHMAMRIAGAGKSIGLTEADVLGLATALSSMGIEAEAGGTAISTIMATIDKDVAMNASSIETWAQTANMSVADFKQAWGSDAVGALSAVLVGMDGAVQSGGNMSQMLDDLGIKSIRQTDTMKRLANNSEFLGRAVEKANAAWGENSALDAEVANRNESLSAQFEMLKNRVFAIAESYGGPLCRGMLDVVEAAEPLIDALASGAKAFADLDEDQQRVVLGALALSAAVGPLLSVLGKGMQTVKGVGKGMQSLAEHIERSKLASQEQAAATRAQTTAAQAGAQAARAQGQAVEASATATRAAGEASKGAAGKVSLLGTAMRGIAAVAVISALMPLVQALAEMASSTDAATASAESLTRSSREQKGRVDELRAAYESAAAAQGEGSDAALRAKAAYEQEAAAFAESARTVSQFAEECAEVAEAHGEMMDSVRSGVADADAQAGAILNLSDKVSALLDVEGRSEGQKAELAAVSGMLNEALGREAVSYDQASDSCNLTSDAVRDLAKAEADRVRGTAALERYNTLMEDSVAVDAQLASAQEELEAASRGWGIWIGDFPVVADDASVAYHDLERAVSDLEGAQADNAAEMENTLEIAKQQAAHDEALAQAVQAVTDGTMSAAEAAEAYSTSLGEGVTESEVATQAFVQEQEAASELSEKVQKIAEDLDEYCASSSHFSEAIAGAGWTTEELAEHLHGCGMEAGDLTKVFEDLASKTCNAFDKIEEAQDVSLDKMLETLEHNRKATEDWSANLQALYEQAGSESERKFLDYIASLGVEYAPVLEDLRNDTTGKLSELAAEYDAAGAACGDALIVRMQLAREGAATEAEGMAVAVALAVQAMAEKTGEGTEAFSAKLAEAGVSMEDLAALSDEELGKLVQGYDGDMAAIKRTLDGFVSKNRSAGAEGGSGLASNYGAHRGAMSASASGLVGAATAQTGRLPSIMNADGTNAGKSFAAALPLYQGTARTNAGKNADAAKSGMTKHSGRAKSWGEHLAQSFGSGIGGMVNWVTNRALDVANAVKGILGHTVPEDGPLREGGEGERRWGRHSIENYATGMLEALPEIQRAADDVALVQARALSGPADGLDVRAQATVTHEVRCAAASTVVAVSDGSADAQVRALRRDFDRFRRELGYVIGSSVPNQLIWNEREVARVVQDSKGAI